MRKLEFESVSLKGYVQVPETAEEFDQLAKKAGACVDEAVNNVLYRGVLADFRSAVVAELERETGIQRKTKDHPEGKKYTNDQKDENGNIVAKKGDPIQVLDETESKYIQRVAAEQGKQPSDYQYIADRVLTQKDDAGNLLISFDPSQTERKAPSTGPTKQDLNSAIALQQAGVADQNKLATALGRMSQLTKVNYDVAKALDQNNSREVNGVANVNDGVVYLAGAYRSYRIALASADALLAA